MDTYFIIKEMLTAIIIKQIDSSGPSPPPILANFQQIKNIPFASTLEGYVLRMFVAIHRHGLCACTYIEVPVNITKNNHRKLNGADIVVFGCVPRRNRHYLAKTIKELEGHRAATYVASVHY